MYHPQKKSPNKILWTIMLGILGFHLIALVIFGGFTVYDALKAKDPAFEEPPPAEKIERVQLEYKVRMQEKQKQSQRPKQKLQVKQISEMKMPDMNIQVPNLNNTANIGRFGNGNFGNIGDGGGLNLGNVSVNLFDIKAKGEKFLFVVDVRRELMQDAKGGIPTYNVIKNDIIRLVNELPSGVLFNMLLFDGASLEIWKPQLVAATATNKEEFEKWLLPVNSSATNLGVRSRNYRPAAFNQPFASRLMTSYGLTTAGALEQRSDAIYICRANSIVLTTAGALEQRPDAIYILSDSLPSLEDLREEDRRTPEEIRKSQEDYLDRVKSQTDFETLQEYQAARLKTTSEMSKRISEFKRNENKARTAKGIAPRVYSSSENSRLRNDMEKEVSKLDFYVPGVEGAKMIDRDSIPEGEVEDWLETQLRLQFDQNFDDRPQLNAIIFRGEDEGFSEEQEDAVDDYVDRFDGDYRVLIGLGEINSASARSE